MGPWQIRPRYNQDAKTTPLILPPAYGLAQIKNETYTAEGPISLECVHPVTQMVDKAISRTHGSGLTSSIRPTW